MVVFTGAFGGIVRDILYNQVPLVFRKELYGSISFLAAWMYFGLTMTSLLMTGFALRILAITMDLELPEFNFDDQNKKG